MLYLSTTFYKFFQYHFCRSVRHRKSRQDAVRPSGPDVIYF